MMANDDSSSAIRRWTQLGGVVLTSIFLLGGITACEEEGPIEEAAEETEDAMESAGDEIEDAADEVEDEID